jgi:hypothetical protein
MVKKIKIWIKIIEYFIVRIFWVLKKNTYINHILNRALFCHVYNNIWFKIKKIMLEVIINRILYSKVYIYMIYF